MSMNLALLPADEKYKIELDKQAAFFVWQVKQGKAGLDVFTREAEKIRDADDRVYFEQAIAKYKQIMKVA